jgi:catechol 2,3-dioxygenase-like lactoylglutathione lyase family enzyme
MLDGVDRVLLAVRDRAAAEATFADILGAEKVREDALEHPYNCQRSVVQTGDSQFEFLEPAGEGPVAEHLERWGEGIFAAGFSTSDLPEIARRMGDTGLHFNYQGSDVFIEPDQTRGMRTILRVSEPREAVGLITGLYEITNIVEDQEEASTFYAGIFGLDRSRFSPIPSEHFGYTGTLTLFDPPTKLDRIEVVQITQPEKAMGRFYAKRGPSIYMCFVETPDVEKIEERLKARAARYEPTGDFPGAGLFIHPTSLHGMLMGVSYTNAAWRWSGRPELAPRAVA